MAVTELRITADGTLAFGMAMTATLALAATVALTGSLTRQIPVSQAPFATVDAAPLGNATDGSISEEVTVTTGGSRPLGSTYWLISKFLEGHVWIYERLAEIWAVNTTTSYQLGFQPTKAGWHL